MNAYGPLNTKCLMLLIIMTTIACDVMAESIRKVGLPLQFHAEAGVRKIDACLMVTEHEFKGNWSEFRQNENSEVAQALKNVIKALINKDKDKLYQLSHVSYGRDAQSFDKQAKALFGQLERVEIVDVPRAYKFDDLVVFFLKFKYKERSFFAPFIFRYQEDKQLGYLPYRTNVITYVLVEDWFFRYWSGSNSGTPEYCDLDLIKKANYRVPLVSSSSSVKKIEYPSNLLLNGSLISDATRNQPSKEKVLSFFSRLTTTLEENKIEKYTKLFTLEGGNRLKEWFDSADAKQIEAYKNSVLKQEPFFIFDLDPLHVIYLKSTLGIQVVYLIDSEDGMLKWVNSSHVTVADNVFKTGALFSSAKLKDPFSIFKVN